MSFLLQITIMFNSRQGLILKLLLLTTLWQMFIITMLLLDQISQLLVQSGNKKCIKILVPEQIKIYVKVVKEQVFRSTMRDVDGSICLYYKRIMLDHLLLVIYSMNAMEIALLQINLLPMLVRQGSSGILYQLKSCTITI